MPSFRVRCFENGDVRWVELAGAATATPADIVRREVGASLARDGKEDEDARRIIVDLSQVPTVGAHTLEAVLEAIPRAGVEVGLIPPPQPGWFADFGAQIDMSATVYASGRHALLALGLDSRGKARERVIDKRRHERVGTSIRSRLWFHSPQGERFGRALVANLSRSGALLTQLDCNLGPDEYRYFAEGDGPLVLALPIIPEKRHIRSRVVRMETQRGRPALGVRFEGIDLALERALDDFLAERAQAPAHLRAAQG